MKAITAGDKIAGEGLLYPVLYETDAGFIRCNVKKLDLIGFIDGGRTA